MTDNYILYEVMGEVVARVKEALNLPVLNYQYGYLEELAETLKQYAADPNYASQMFPLVWLKPRFKIVRGGNQSALFGSVRDMRVFIMHATEPNLKAKDRLERNYKPVIYPIYRALMEHLSEHEAIEGEANREHAVIDDFFWGDQQQAYLPYTVDCLTIESLNLSIYTKMCQPNFKSF